MLFLDEIHRMSRPAEEMLYLAMEDFRDVIVGKAQAPQPSPWSCRRSPWSVPRGPAAGALRDRFGFTGHLDSTDRRVSP